MFSFSFCPSFPEDCWLGGVTANDAPFKAWVSLWAATGDGCALVFPLAGVGVKEKGTRAGGDVTAGAELGFQCVKVRLGAGERSLEIGAVGSVGGGS